MANMCQSCGMPLNKDEKGGGSEADGSLSTVYCSYCYEGGKFLQPDVSATEMQAFCLDVLHKKGMPKFMAWIFTRGIPKLDRWTA